MSRVRVPAVWLLTLVLAPAAVADEPGFSTTSDEELALARGDVFARVLDSDDPIEVVTLAGTRLRAHGDRIVAAALEPGGLRRRENGQAGRVGDPPVPADFTALEIEPGELAGLRECRVGRCKLRLPVDTIEALQRIDWQAPEAPERARQVLLAMLSRRAVRYLECGHAALADYADSSKGTRVAAGTRLLLERPLPGLDAAPALREYLERFPEARPGLAGESLVWHAERVYRRQVVSLEHVVVLRQDAAGVERVLVVSKKIYASHYFEGSLEEAEFVRRTGEETGRLLIAGRSRTDIRPSGFNWLERLLLRRLIRGRLTGELRELRERLEAPAQPPTAPVSAR